MNILKNYGLTEEWAQKSEVYKELILGRVIAAYNRERIDVVTEAGSVSCRMSNKLLKKLNGSVITGDWICIGEMAPSTFMVEALLERKNCFIRRKAGTINDEQIIGVNLDRIFLVTAVDDDFNPRRLERYIAQAMRDQIPVTIVLSKADLTNQIGLYNKIAKEIHLSGDVVTISSLQGSNGVKSLMSYLRKGETVALVGSSGVGKSTIVNTLFGKDIQRVHEVNEKTGKGGHTTTNKQLRAFDKGFLLLDTPGMREFGMLAMGSAGGRSDGFDDIEEWVAYCKFSNCRHDSEAGCAVKQAVEDGHISPKRLKNFKKINYDQNYLWVKGRRISKNKLQYGKGRKNNDRR